MDKVNFRGCTSYDFDGFQEAMKPAVDWFQKNCSPHHRIIIEMDRVELVSGEMVFPLKVKD